MDASEIKIPDELLPTDGRFGSGPSKIPALAVDTLAHSAARVLGTSHRQPTVKYLVRGLRRGLSDLFALPDGYEVVLGNGGATAFWDAQVFGLIERKSQHLVCGEFSSKFAEAARLAPHLDDPEVVSAEPGSAPFAHRSVDVDVYALIHNETSTGVSLPVKRVAPGGLVTVDATSAAGGLEVDPAEFDVYYFAPQKGFASDGGLWLALCSPAAIHRIEGLAASGRYIPPFLDLKVALDNSRKDQTYNTPALATIFLMLEQVEWINSNGGLDFSAGRSERSAAILYGWAETCEVATPFVSDPAFRSNVVGTIDFAEHVGAKQISAVLRANGILDTEPYRKLGRNQLRIAMYPAIDPEDVERLTHSIDHVLDVLLGS